MYKKWFNSSISLFWLILYMIVKLPKKLSQYNLTIAQVRLSFYIFKWFVVNYNKMCTLFQIRFKHFNRLNNSQQLPTMHMVSGISTNEFLQIILHMFENRPLILYESSLYHNFWYISLSHKNELISGNWSTGVLTKVNLG